MGISIPSESLLDPSLHAINFSPLQICKVSPFVPNSFVREQKVVRYKLTDLLDPSNLWSLALRSGDASAVNEMYRILLPFAKRFAPPSYNLKKQLQAEYGVSAEDGAIP